MNKAKNMKAAFDAASTLPEEAQHEIAGEILSLVAAYHADELTSQQKKIIRERLAAGPEFAPKSSLVKLLRRYNKAL